MSSSDSPSLNPASIDLIITGLHPPQAEACPTCDQPIPHERSEEIKKRIASRQAMRDAQIASRVSHEVELEKARAVAEARQEASAAAQVQIERARREEREAAEANTIQRVEDATRGTQAEHEATKAKLAIAENARSAAQESYSRLNEQLSAEREASSEALDAFRRQAADREERIRIEAAQEAQATTRAEIASMRSAHQALESGLLERAVKAEGDLATAQQERAVMLAAVDQAQHDKAAALEKAEADAAIREANARIAGKEDAEIGLQAHLHQMEQEKIDAESRARAAEEGARQLQHAHNSEIEARISEVRNAKDAEKVQAVNAAKAEAYEDKLKMSERLAEVQRAFDKKTADEIGEGAEVNLFEDLKEIFEGDKIERVGKGNAGADIIHVVMLNGVECGKIIYDSKDHKQWRWDFVTKLATDKIAAKADHAILSTRPFPEGTRQLHLHDGIVIANPARVVPLVQVVREHILKTHTLRMSNEAKLQKTSELYSFITSAQFTDLLARIDVHAQELQSIQDDERKAHEAVWKKQSIRFRSIQKAGGDLSNRIDIIIGTAGTSSRAVNDE